MAKKKAERFQKIKEAEEIKKTEEVAKTEEHGGSEIVEETKEMEQTIWSVRVGSQTLYKVFLPGRTRLDNMSAEENKKAKDVLSEAIDTVAGILKDRTTQHAVEKKEKSGYPDVEGQAS